MDWLSPSLTTTINLLFGSQLMIPETGIIMNNEMNGRPLPNAPYSISGWLTHIALDFSIPGSSNAFGYIPSPSNYIRPGNRPLSHPQLWPTLMGAILHHRSSGRKPNCYNYHPECYPRGGWRTFCVWGPCSSSPSWSTWCQIKFFSSIIMTIPLSSTWSNAGTMWPGLILAYLTRVRPRSSVCYKMGLSRRLGSPDSRTLVALRYNVRFFVFKIHFLAVFF